MSPPPPNVSPVTYNSLPPGFYNMTSADVKKCLHEFSKDSVQDPGNFPIQGVDCAVYSDEFQAVSAGALNATLLFQGSDRHVVSIDPTNNNIVARVLNVSQILNSIWIITQSMTSDSENVYRIQPITDSDQCVTEINPEAASPGGGSGSGISAGLPSTLILKQCINEGKNTDQDFTFLLNSTATAASDTIGSTTLTVNL